MSTENTIPETLINGRYRVLQPIGSGGLGQVFYGVDEQLQRPVAIKRLLEDGDIREKYQDGWMEARALASLQHPNIVTLFDFGGDESGAYFVMEYIAGETMEKMGTVALLNEKDFRDIARQCLNGLAAAHELGIVHRDIKPTNIMVQQGPAGEVIAKILDFGLAKFQKAPEPQSTDHENNLLGSIYFMAPEQFSREPIDGRADLYALGNVFYYGLTGRMAHAADSIEQIIFSHLHHLPVPVHELRPDLNPALCLWVHQLMRRNPLERPQSAQEALQLLEPDGPGFYRDTGTFQAAEPERKAAVSWVKWLAAILVIGGLSGIGIWLKKESPPVPAAASLPPKKEETAEAPVTVKPPVKAAPVVITETLPQRPSDSPAEEGLLDPLDPERIQAAMGREARVEGIPVRVGENKSGTILYLNFSENFRSTLSLVFFVKDRPDDFTKAKLESYLGKKIRFRGKVGEYNGSPQIKVDSLEQIEMAEP